MARVSAWDRETVRVARLGARRSLRQVAEAVGLSPSALCRFENGQRGMSQESRRKYLEAIFADFLA